MVGLVLGRDGRSAPKVPGYSCFLKRFAVQSRVSRNCLLKTALLAIRISFARLSLGRTFNHHFTNNITAQSQAENANREEDCVPTKPAPALNIPCLHYMKSTNANLEDTATVRLDGIMLNIPDWAVR